MIFIDGLSVNFVYVQKKGLKNLYISIKNSHTVEIKSHPKYPKEKIAAFLHSKKNWILKKIELMKTRESNHDNALLFGTPLINYSDISGIEHLYMQELEWYIKSVIDDISSDMGVKYSSIKIKKYKAIWGSCDSQNNLKFNLKLASLDKKTIRYVIIHELAHIKHKHHQKEFWHFVELFEPNFKQIRKNLKNIGSSL